MSWHFLPAPGQTDVCSGLNYVRNSGGQTHWYMTSLIGNGKSSDKVIYQVTHFSNKGLLFSLCGPQSHNCSTLPLQHKHSHKLYVKVQAWLHSNKALFTKTCTKAGVTLRLQFSGPCAKLNKLLWQTTWVTLDGRVSAEVSGDLIHFPFHQRESEKDSAWTELTGS